MSGFKRLPFGILLISFGFCLPVAQADLVEIFREDFSAGFGAFTNDGMVHVASDTGYLKGVNNNARSASAFGVLTPGITGEGLLRGLMHGRPRSNGATFISLADSNGAELFRFGNVLSNGTLFEATRGDNSILATIDASQHAELNHFNNASNEYFIFRLDLDSVNDTLEFMVASTDSNFGAPGNFISSGVVALADYSIADLATVTIYSNGLFPGPDEDRFDNPTVLFQVVPEPGCAGWLALASIGGLFYRRRQLS